MALYDDLGDPTDLLDDDASGHTLDAVRPGARGRRDRYSQNAFDSSKSAADATVMSKGDSFLQPKSSHSSLPPPHPTPLSSLSLQNTHVPRLKRLGSSDSLRSVESTHSSNSLKIRRESAKFLAALELSTETKMNIPVSFVVIFMRGGDFSKCVGGTYRAGCDILRITDGMVLSSWRRFL